MTAISFISKTSFLPTTADAGLGRRLDFAKIAGLFAEAEEPTPRRETTSRTARVGLLILMLLGAIGDTLLVAQPDALTIGLSARQPAQGAHRVVIF